MAAYQVHKSTDEVDINWDNFVHRTKGGWYHQTSLWGKLKKINGWRTIRLVVSSHNVIVGGAQVLIRSISHHIPITIGILPKGPVIHPDHFSAELLQVIFSELQKMVSENHIVSFAFQPPERAEAYPKICHEYHYIPSLQENISPTCDVLINLEDSYETMLSHMKKRTRHNIRHSHDDGIIVREGGLADLQCFHQILSSSSQRKKFLADDEHYIQTLYQLFCERGWITLLIAEYQRMPIAAMILIAFGDTVIPWRSGWTGSYGHLHPNEALRWEAISWAKSHRYRYFSIGGVSSATSQSNVSEAVLVKESNDTVTSFKLGFGGTIVTYPQTYYYLPNPFLRWGYHRIYPLIKDSPLMEYFFSMLSKR